MSESLRFIDAFAGAGGMSLGLERAGFELALAFDLDLCAVATMRKNHPGRENCIHVADINTLLDNSTLRDFGITPGAVDLVTGGPPCQGFSIQRTIGDDADDRNDLVIRFMEFVALVKPRCFLMENVPALGGTRGKAILDKALQYIASQGYLTDSKVLDAADFGVPQRRRRRFILGERTDTPFMSVALPDPPKTRIRTTVRDAIGHLPEPPLDGSDHPDFPNHRRDLLSPQNLERIAALKPGQGRQHLPDALLAECHKRSPAEIGHRNVYGRMSWDEPSPTITARFDSFTRGQFGHPEQDRTISLREGAVLQTFPLEYVFIGNKVEIARQIGNAVPPTLACVIGDILRDRL